MKTFIKSLAIVLLLAVLAPLLQAATAFPVRYSANSRYLVDKNGTPFPILGRTSWCLTSLATADYREYLDDCAARGYNAIEVNVINHSVRGNRPPYGGNNDLPFTRRLDGGTWSGALTYGNINSEAPDFTTPNEPFWVLVDQMLAYAESKGILVFMFPAYVGFNGSEQGWMQEILANGASRMQTYGAWIANRYKNQKNLVWMMGGDMGTGAHPFTSAQTAVETGLFNGLKSVAGQQSIYYSAEWDSESIGTDQTTFGTSMTLNGAYSWTGDVANHGRRAYAYGSTRPAYLLEEPYDEEGPDGNSVNPSATQPVRRFQWWGWLSTIGGYISGNGYIIRFRSDTTTWNWRNHLNTQGTRDMGRLNGFIGSIAWYNLVPSGLGGMRTLITSGGSSVSAADYVAAAATADGTLLVAYLPPAHSGSITVDMGAMSGAVRARWFDPTSAAYTDVGTGLANSGTRSFTPPDNNSVGQRDWVLVLDRGAGSAPPTISNIADQSTTTNTPTGAIPFTIADPDTTTTSLTLSKASSNPTLIPASNIVFGGSGSNRTVTVTPAAGQTGSSIITVSVSDGNSTASDTFTVTVTAPTAAGVVRVNAGGGTFTDNLGNVWSADTGYNTGTANTVTNAINNTVNDTLYQTERWDDSVSPELAYSFSMANGNYQVNLHFAETYSPAFGVGARVFDVLVEGQVRVDNLDIYSRVGANTPLVISLPVTVSDGQLNISFAHVVQNPKICGVEIMPASIATTPPTISDIPNQTTVMNTPTPAIPFTVNDAQTPAGSLTLSKSSSNPTLVPTGNIVFGGSGSNRTVTVTPASGQTGSATLTVTVSDGTNSASDTLSLTVNSTAPTAVLRVNAGGGAFTDSVGRIWSADTGYNTGTANSVTTPINNTVDDALYQTERWDDTPNPELTYTFTVPNGSYQVNLHFAETYSPAFSVGARVFDVLIEGQLKISDLDIYSQVGANTPLVMSLPVTVSDGELNISFVHNVQNPTICAIEVLATSGSSPSTPPSPALITSVDLDTAGIVQVSADAAAGTMYTLEASSDMKTWTQVDVGNNTSGTVVFTEPKTTNSMRFYRVLSKPH